MYKIAKIKFIPKTEKMEGISQKIDDILGMLCKNGQIIEGWIIEKTNSNYIANVITADNDSLDKKYFNKFLINELTNFNIETVIVGDDTLATDSCKCKNHSFYILAIDPDLVSSPIICGDCGEEIPLTKIPYLYNEEEHYSILNFQKTYKAVDQLWMDSLSDRFTKRQITDHNSQLNKRGLEICAELENKLERPVYYLLRNPIGGWFEYEKNNKVLEVCPKCGGSFEYKEAPYSIKVCNTCRLAFLQHKNKNG